MQRHVNATRVDDLPSLKAGVVADLHLLLLINLAGVDELLDGAGSEKTIDRDVSRLPKSVGSIHGLQVMCRVYKCGYSSIITAEIYTLQLGSHHGSDKQVGQLTGRGTYQK